MIVERMEPNYRPSTKLARVYTLSMRISVPLITNTLRDARWFWELR